LGNKKYDNTFWKNEIDNLSDLFELMQTIESDTLLINEEKLNNLSYFESEGGIAGAYARGFIQRYAQSEYKEPVFLPEIMMVRKQNFERNVSTEDSYLRVYPNPAKDFISIEYKLNHEIAKPVIKIVSVNGQLVNYKELLNNQDIVIFEIKDLTQGNYVVYLENNGKKTDSVIITITK
jgi:hypothetical protein